jgi:hypothetical protein
MLHDIVEHSMIYLGVSVKYASDDFANNPEITGNHSPLRSNFGVKVKLSNVSFNFSLGGVYRTHIVVDEVCVKNMARPIIFQNLQSTLIPPE